MTQKMIVNEFYYHHKGTNRSESGIYLTINDEIKYVIINDVFAHEGLSTDDFIPMIKMMKVETNYIGFINDDLYHQLLAVARHQFSELSKLNEYFTLEERGE